MKKLTILIVFFEILYPCFCKMNGEHVKQLADKLSTLFHQQFQDITKFKELDSKYKDLHRAGIYKEKSINVTDISKKFNNNLENLLISKIESVKKIKKNTENLHAKYKYDKEIKPYNYLNNDNQNNPVKQEPKFFLNVNVSVNHSYIQTPTNIYKYHKEILNEAKWSEGLDKSFKENYKATPTLLWQYFCSEKGFIRSFPGLNKDPNSVDYYDCRRRLWYSQAINSPKDVIILLDVSGSMTGIHFTIAKIAVKSLINTLQVDDFMNVLIFRDTVQYLIPCLTNLTQATSRRKELFRNTVDNLPGPSGVSKIKNAFHTAFDVFKRSNAESSSSLCTKVILLISDGIEEDASIHEELENLNVNNDVIIFSYIIGLSQHKEEMKRIACRNGGDYYEMPTVGNVWNRVLKYQSRLSQPLIAKNKSDIIFTPLYLDSLGLGMMNTISTGVFNYKDESLIGVIGLDVRITLLEQQYPTHEMGVFGHAFAINNNGMVLVHPRFRSQEGYLPDPETLYLNEIEYTVKPDRIKEITKEMIDGKVLCKHAELHWLYFGISKRRLVRYNATYCYRPSKGTPFITGVSVPQKNQNVFIIANISEEIKKQGIAGLISKSTNEIVKIANCIYCDFQAKAQKNQPSTEKLYPNAIELYEFLSMNINYDTKTLSGVREASPDVNATFPQRYNVAETLLNVNETLDSGSLCANESLLHLLVDSYLLSTFKNMFWKETLKPPINNRFIITRSGLITSIYKTKKKPFFNRNIFRDERVSHPLAFHIQGEDDNLVFTTSLHHINPKSKKIKKDNKITISKLLLDKNIWKAVVGFEISTFYIKQILLDTSTLFDYDCDDGKCISHHCDDVDNVWCYLLDEHAYVITGNQKENQQGYFFGYVNGEIMKKLETTGVYKTNVFLDTQSECLASLKQDSSSKRITSIFSQVSNVMMYILNVFFTYLYQLFTLSISSINIIKSQSVKSKNVSCTKEVSIHTIANYTINNANEYIYNNDCNVSYVVQTIKNTNLILLVYTNNCIDEVVNVRYTNEPIRIDENDVCSERKHYRKALPMCYTSKHQDVKCGDSSKLNASLKLTVILIIVFYKLIPFQ